MGFDGTARCFFEANVDATVFCGSLKIARQAQILTPAPIKSHKCQGLKSASLLLKDALKKDFALHTGNDFYLVHSGILWISCSEPTYYKAGIEMKHLKNRYHARFDLTKTNKRLEQSCLLNQSLDFSITTDTARESSGISTVSAPPFQVDQDDFEDWAPHFYEWVSLVSLNSPILHSNNTLKDPVFCEYFEYPGSRQMDVHCTVIDGLITPEYVKSILSQAPGWIIITLHGFETSPMAWDRPHLPGSHGYTLLKNGETLNAFKLVSRDDL